MIRKVSIDVSAAVDHHLAWCAPAYYTKDSRWSEYLISPHKRSRLYQALVQAVAAFASVDVCEEGYAVKIELMDEDMNIIAEIHVVIYPNMNYLSPMRAEVTFFPAFVPR